MNTLLRTGHFPGCPEQDSEDAYCPCKRTGYLILIGIATVLFFLEVGGGAVSHSTALLADAWHLMADTFVYAAIVYAATLKLKGVREDREPLDRKWSRVTANILLAVAFGNICFAVVRLYTGMLSHVHGDYMLLIAGIGFFGNIVMMGILSIFHIHHEPHDPEQGDWVHRFAILHTLADLGISASVVFVSILVYFQLLQGVMGDAALDASGTIVVSSLLFILAVRMKRHIPEPPPHQH